MEIIIVDDGSSPEDGQLPISKIVKQLQKSTKIPITVLEHSQNMGLVEARRTAVYAAKGEYIFNLDSDDTLPSDAIKSLYEEAEKSNADIIQGKCSVTGNAASELIQKKETAINNTFTGKLTASDLTNQILDKYLLEQNIMGFVWGKLIRREVYLEAFNRIPPISCTFAEDLIQSIWIYNYARSFSGIDAKVYNYSISDGISSRTIIKDLERWEKVCTTASVFTAIITECEQNGNPFTEDQMTAIKIFCQKYVANNLQQLQHAVTSEIKTQAYEMLCEYWGEDLVKYIEEKLKDNSAS